MKNIVLTGFMATGKTTVGRRLARKLGLEFVDTDYEVERVTGKTVREIFEKYGVVRFRSEESLVIKRLAGCTGFVVATGGGAVLDEDNVLALRQNGILIRLTAPVSIIAGRVRNKRTRPLLDGIEDLEGYIRKLMAEREIVYSRSADFTVDTGIYSREAAVDIIISYLRGRLEADG